MCGTAQLMSMAAVIRGSMRGLMLEMGAQLGPGCDACVNALELMSSEVNMVMAVRLF